jgi:enamine deaminase RidA (YjgF/YER057c/UK114 family)
MRILQPKGWEPPRGYSNGVEATGRLVFVAGQVAFDERGRIVGDDLVEQVRQALRNVVAVVAEGGGRPEHIARMTWYVTDTREYRQVRPEIGRVYREVIGAHYPAMTLVEVAALLEEAAKVEIEATAVVPA